MAIRIRTVNGVRVALCAVESDPMPGDLYLDDGDHYALAAKFALDWQGHPEIQYPEEWAIMATQKVRDAEEELNNWLAIVITCTTCQTEVLDYQYLHAFYLYLGNCPNCGVHSCAPTDPQELAEIKSKIELSIEKRKSRQLVVKQRLMDVQI